MNIILPLEIRRMTLKDLDEVIRLDHASFSLPWPESSFRFEIEKNECSRCWVALLDRRIVGIMVAWLIVDEIHIATFAVDPVYRRQGIAQRLLAHTLLDGLNSGGEKGFLEVREGNLPA
ncbi:MAG: GNAT family N-acetyltransferase, partial [Anaerolineae bacterium]|nr:GNAT family N-acetyltransferase [Anaerolineae bacterium]